MTVAYEEAARLALGYLKTHARFLEDTLESLTSSEEHNQRAGIGMLRDEIEVMRENIDTVKGMIDSVER